MIRAFCILFILAIIVWCSGCMGVNAPAMPKIQPLNVNIQKNNAQIIDKNVITPVPTSSENVTVTPTTEQKIVFV